MRQLSIVFLVLFGTSIDAAAGSRSGTSGGSTSGGGRLASVSAGLGSAAAGSGASGSNARGSSADWAVACDSDQYRRRLYDGVCVRRCAESELYRVRDGVCVRRAVVVGALTPTESLEAEAEAPNTPASPAGTARITAYAGAQKVFESDGAISLELAITDRWFRLAGSLTRFYERQPSGDTLTLTMPSLALGVRIDDSQTTRVYLEAGVVGAVTRQDPMMDSSNTGVLGGVVAEHALSKHATLIGAARVMGFKHDVRAAALRAGIRYRHVQATFGVLDFNVGPALYGPEIGVGF